MARRPNAPSEEQLTTSELLELRRNWKRCHATNWRISKATHNACRYVMQLPSPRLIQELVQAWKILQDRERAEDVRCIVNNARKARRKSLFERNLDAGPETIIASIRPG